MVVKMIDTNDGQRIASDALIAIDALQSIVNSHTSLYPAYLKEKCEQAQRCLDFMKCFYEEGVNL